MKLVKVGARYVAQSTYEERAVPKAAGFRWDRDQKCWWTTDAGIAGRLAEHADGDALKAELAAGVQARIAKLNASRAADTDVQVPAPDGCEYLPFQRAGIAVAVGRDATLFGDEPGLGKTIQAAGVINADTTVRRVLVICPASLRLNWKRELERWLVRPLTVGIATAAVWPETDIVVINWDIAEKLRSQTHGETWDMVVLDEAHLAKNPKAKRTQAVVGVEGRKGQAGDAGIPARRRLALTGTPIVNRPAEAFPVLRWLDPETWPRFWPYAMRYCAAHQTRYGWDISGASHLDELQEKLRLSTMVRRLKSEVLLELPAKRRQVLVIPANGAQATVDAETQAWRAHEETVAALRAQAELAKASDDDAAYDAAVAALSEATRVAFTEMSQRRHETAVAKVPAVAAHVTDVLDGGTDKAVIMAHHHDVIAGLRETLVAYEPVTLTGETAMADRQAAVDRFQTDPTCRVFIGSITAAGVGITLTAAAQMVFAELDWVPGNVTQAEDRIHRIGQRASVLIQHVVLDGSLDARMAHTLVAKQDVLDRMLDRETEPAALPALPDQGATETAPKSKVAKLAERVTSDGIAVIHEALRRIAGLCDGAQALDGHGFNKVDAAIGRDLALRPGLTRRQAALGWIVVRKYTRQLGPELTTAIDAAVQREAI